mmetsp:Transcript_20715/g.26816  ORF Transcript_20715/g.26816 Transcript_20715/m.26816 type:complete len:262 (+) Transcript_20715:66-851(+)
MKLFWVVSLVSIASVEALGRIQQAKIKSSNLKGNIPALVPPSAATIESVSTVVPSPTKVFLEPLLQVVRWYDSNLKIRPLRTKVITNSFTSSLGDILAQSLTCSSIDPQRTLAWSIAGLCYFGPILHMWYNGLARMETFFMNRWKTSKTTAVIYQIAFNQFIGAAIVNACFLYFISFTKMIVTSFAAGSFSTFNPAAAFGFATHQLHTTYASMMLANFAFWPVPTFINLYLVPLRWRVLFSNTCSIFWKCCLSIITTSTLR